MATDPVREVLRTQINQARAAHASLQAERTALLSLASHRARRPADPTPLASDTTISFSHPLPRGEEARPERIALLGRELVELEERTLLYRALCGATCFEIDLDIGRRARAARRAALKANGSPPPEGQGEDAPSLGLGVRIDTFAQGSFYEPYYLVFARQDQLDLAGEPAVLRAALPLRPRGLGTPDPSGLLLARHTLPPFLPLDRLLAQHLRPHAAAAPAQDQDQDKEKTAAGGFALLPLLQGLAGFQPFLTHLNTYLQAFVSRREQANALAFLDLPGRTDTPPVPTPAPTQPGRPAGEGQGTGEGGGEPATPATVGGAPSLALSAYATAGFASIAIRWLVPRPSERDMAVWRERRARYPAPAPASSDSDQEGELDRGLPWLPLDGSRWLEEDEVYRRDQAGQGLQEQGQGQEQEQGQEQDPARAERRRVRMRPSRRQRALRTVDIRLQYTNLESDEPGAAAATEEEEEAPTAAAQQAAGMAGSSSGWSQREHALVVVEDVRLTPRVLPASSADDGDTLTTTTPGAYVERRTRRPDWEALFLRAGKQAAFLPDTPVGKRVAVGAHWTLAAGVASVAAAVWEAECHDASSA